MKRSRSSPAGWYCRSPRPNCWPTRTSNGCSWAARIPAPPWPTPQPQALSEGVRSMSDMLVDASREPLQASFSDAANPLGLDGVEFIEYATPKPQALGQVLEMMGFKPVARHRSREVQLY